MDEAYDLLLRLADRFVSSILIKTFQRIFIARVHLVLFHLKL